MRDTSFERLLNPEFADAHPSDVFDLPVHAIRGITERDADALREILHVETVRDLARNPIVRQAQALVRSARTPEVAPAGTTMVAGAGTTILASGSNLNSGQQEFIDEIKEQVNKLLGTRLDGTFEIVNAPAGFHYFQDRTDNGGNENLMHDLDSTIAPASNGLLALNNDDRFSTRYFKILSGARYSYSKADDAVLNDPASAAQKEEVIKAAKAEGFCTGTFGITDVIRKALKDYPTPDPSETNGDQGGLAYAARELQKVGDTQTGNALLSWINENSEALALANRQAESLFELSAAKDHTKNPSDKNGGFAVGAPDKNEFYVAYQPLPPSMDVVQALDNDKSKISFTVSASNFSSTNTKFSIEGKAGFELPIADVLTLGIDGKASFDFSKFTTAESKLDMHFEYPGVYQYKASPMPLSTDYKTGWYDEELLEEIVKGSDNDSVTGFKVSPSDLNIGDTFGPGKTFARLKTFVISRQPTITLTFKAAQAEEIKKDFKEGASVSAKLFGLFDVGGVSQNLEIKKVDTSSADGSVTVTLAPPDPKGTRLNEERIAYVVGGVPSYPPNDR